MKLSYYPYTLELKHEFRISSNTRKTTPVVLVEIEHNGITGYGEASLPPYLGETTESVIKFINKINFEKYTDPLDFNNIIYEIDKIEEGNTAAKASIDLALHDLYAKIKGEALYKIWNADKEKTPVTSFTIGIDEINIIRVKVKEADEYKILKVKLGNKNDKEIITAIREETDKQIYVDVNQGWNDKIFALEMIEWLIEKYVVLIEQPLHKNKIDETAWLTENSPLPIIADEAIQRINDIEKLRNVYSGINIKLMKCTGLAEAFKMINSAKENNLKILLGCMTETSCAISAAASLSPFADWADLDGNLLIKNDPFEGVKIENGRIILNDNPGIGISIIKK